VARLPTPGTPPEDALSKSVLALRRPLYVAAAATLIVLIALALTSAWRQYDDAKEKAADDLRTRAVLAATVFDTYFAGQLQALSAIAASPAVTAADATAMRAYFAQASAGSTARVASKPPVTLALAPGSVSATARTSRMSSRRGSLLLPRRSSRSARGVACS
jgi:hypothetical protein